MTTTHKEPAMNSITIGSRVYITHYGEYGIVTGIARNGWKVRTTDGDYAGNEFVIAEKKLLLVEADNGMDCSDGDAGVDANAYVDYLDAQDAADYFLGDTPIELDIFAVTNALGMTPSHGATETRALIADTLAVGKASDTQAIRKALRGTWLRPSIYALANGDISLKFEDASRPARWYAERIVKALPGAEIVRTADGAVALVIVRMPVVSTI